MSTNIPNTKKSSRNCLHLTSIWFRFTTGLWGGLVFAHLICFVFVFFLLLFRPMFCVYQVADSGSPLERGFSGYITFQWTIVGNVLGDWKNHRCTVTVTKD